MNDQVIKALEQSGALHNESLWIDLCYISFIDFSLDHVEVLIVINVFQNSAYYFVWNLPFWLVDGCATTTTTNWSWDFDSGEDRQVWLTEDPEEILAAWGKDGFMDSNRSVGVRIVQTHVCQSGVAEQIAQYLLTEDFVCLLDVLFGLWGLFGCHI